MKQRTLFKRAGRLLEAAGYASCFDPAAFLPHMTRLGQLAEEATATNAYALACIRGTVGDYQQAYHSRPTAKTQACIAIEVFHVSLDRAKEEGGDCAAEFVACALLPGLLTALNAYRATLTTTSL